MSSVECFIKSIQTTIAMSTKKVMLVSKSLCMEYNCSREDWYLVLKMHLRFGTYILVLLDVHHLPLQKSASKVPLSEVKGKIPFHV